MILIRTIMNVLPQKQKEMVQTLLSLLERAGKEKGCLRYEIFSDIEDENAFILISEWKTRQHLDSYIKSDKFSVLLGTKSLLSEPLKFRIFTVTDSEGTEAVHSIRKRKLLVPSRGTSLEK